MKWRVTVLWGKYFTCGSLLIDHESYSLVENLQVQEQSFIKKSIVKTLERDLYLRAPKYT